MGCDGALSEGIFDRYPEEYDRWFEDHRAVYHAELAQIRRFLPRPDSCAIEVGVGSGRFAAPLGIPIGLDLSLPLARMARGRGVDVIRGKGEAIPIGDGMCSSALLVTVICFLDDPVSVLREVHRILAPGGILVVGFLERKGEVAQRCLHGGGEHRFLSHARFYSSGEVRDLLDRTGFFVTGVESRAGFSVIAARKS